MILATFCDDQRRLKKFFFDVIQMERARWTCRTMSGCRQNACYTIESFDDFLCDGQEVAGGEDRIHAVCRTQARIGSVKLVSSMFVVCQLFWERSQSQSGSESQSPSHSQSQS